MAGELNGPIPAVVCAATVHSYVVYGIRESSIMFVSTVVNCSDSAVSAVTITMVSNSQGYLQSSGTTSLHLPSISVHIVRALEYGPAETVIAVTEQV